MLSSLAEARTLTGLAEQRVRRLPGLDYNQVIESGDTFWMIDSAWIWLIIGALLVLSEFFMTGLVAIFFGVGAIMVGILIGVGLLNELPEQIIVFAVLSVGTLLFARERVKVWFQGAVSERWDGDRDLIASRGQRVTVTRSFVEGFGRVNLSGAEWKAESIDGNHAEGATVWVIGHQGITLTVSGHRPEDSSPHDD